jgi:hypothetical protein
LTSGVENLASNPASALGLPTGGSSDSDSEESESSDSSDGEYDDSDSESAATV